VNRELHLKEKIGLEIKVKCKLTAGIILFEEGQEMTLFALAFKRS